MQLLSLRDVDGGDEQSHVTVMDQRLRVDRDLDLGSVRLYVAGVPSHLVIAGAGFAEFAQLAPVRGRPYIEDRHVKEPFAAIAIMGDGRVIDGEEAQTR